MVWPWRVMAILCSYYVLIPGALQSVPGNRSGQAELTPCLAVRNAKPKKDRTRIKYAEENPDSAAPITASLDKHAKHAIWFFTARDNRWAELGAATATYASKGHDLFARFAGTLSEETDRARLDKQWSNFIEA